MTVTTTTLTRAAGLAAVAAGSLFVAVQVKHLEITVDFVQGTQWTVRQGVKVSMALLALAGIAGIYLRRARHLDPHRSARFAGLALAHPADGTTTLSGAVADQAELHGILIRCATSASRSSPAPRRRRAPPRREHRAGSAHVVAHIYDTAYVVGMPQRAVLEAITDPTRRRILDAVRGGECSVTELVDAVGMNQPGVSRHLRVLREAGLVEVRRDAQRRLYRLRAEPLRELDAWLEPYRAELAGRLDSLERHLERTTRPTSLKERSS